MGADGCCHQSRDASRLIFRICCRPLPRTVITVIGEVAKGKRGMSRNYTGVFEAALLLGLGFLCSALCLAQSEQGAITGVVIDPSGAAVPNAKVSAVNTNTQVVAATETNGTGNYKIPYLPPGPYTITAEKTGFTPARVTNISLPVGLTATINVTLGTGTVHTEVSVQANSDSADAPGKALKL